MPKLKTTILFVYCLSLITVCSYSKMGKNQSGAGTYKSSDAVSNTRSSVSEKTAAQEKATVGESKKKYCKNAPTPLYIATYDHSGQAVHPKVLYFSNAWNGWKYWMSYTPYPFSNDDMENPSVAVSQDGINWAEPNGIKDPIIKAPSDVKKGGHYSDPHLVMHGQIMELWYRYNPGRGTGKANNKVNKIFRITSTDGINWMSPQLIFNGYCKYFSPAILYENGLYKVWFSDSDGKLYYTESKDLRTWTKPVAVNLKIDNFNMWHQDVIKTRRGYEIVFTAYHKGQFNRNNQCLYYSVSTDGLHFNTPVLILSPSKSINSLDNKMIYRSSLIDLGGQYNLYYSAMDINKRWHIFMTAFNPDGT